MTYAERRSGSGPFVEPIQLQVVCLRPWENRKDKTVITAADLSTVVGEVDAALVGYYADKVRRRPDLLGEPRRVRRRAGPAVGRVLTRAAVDPPPQLRGSASTVTRTRSPDSAAAAWTNWATLSRFSTAVPAVGPANGIGAKEAGVSGCGCT